MKCYALALVLLVFSALSVEAGWRHRSSARYSATSTAKYSNYQSCQSCQAQPQFQSATMTTTAMAMQSMTMSFGVGHQLLALHNQERARLGLPPLRLDPGLAAEAHQAAAEQARRGAIGHWLPLRGGAENAAAGQTTESEVHQSWVRSRGHFGNITGPYSAVGFAKVGSFWAARFR